MSDVIVTWEIEEIGFLLWLWKIHYDTPGSSIGTTTTGCSLTHYGACRNIKSRLESKNKVKTDRQIAREARLEHL